jgi:hypothetical protein
MLPALERDHDERGDVDSVPHREVSVALQGPDEQDEERFVHDQLAEHAKALFFALKLGAVPLQDRVVGNLQTKIKFLIFSQFKKTPKIRTI